MLLLVSYLHGPGKAAQLGPQKADKVSTDLFADVGKVYVERFEIEGLNATLNVRIEDVQGEWCSIFFTCFRRGPRGGGEVYSDLVWTGMWG